MTEWIFKSNLFHSTSCSFGSCRVPLTDFLTSLLTTKKPFFNMERSVIWFNLIKHSHKQKTVLLYLPASFSLEDGLVYLRRVTETDVALQTPSCWASNFMVSTYPGRWIHLHDFRCKRFHGIILKKAGHHYFLLTLFFPSLLSKDVFPTNCSYLFIYRSSRL